MSGPIFNASSRPINVRTGTVPDVSGALFDWFQPMVFTRVSKIVEGFQVVETPTPINFRGVLQPFNTRQLVLKPEGERAWTWFTLHADPSLTLQVDDVVTYLGKQTRVASRKDFVLYGYVEYEIIQDYMGAGP